MSDAENPAAEAGGEKPAAPGDEGIVKDHGVRVVRAYGNMAVGRIIFPPNMLRQKLIQEHWVEAVMPPEYQDRQIKDAPVNRMMRARRRGAG
jgi:hypothetical protein